MTEKARKRLTGTRVFFKDRTSKKYQGPELAAALAIVKVPFAANPGP